MAQNSAEQIDCLICSFPLSQRKYFAVIPCSCSDIIVCAVCAIRLRTFERNRTCPFCKAPWKTFLISKEKYKVPYTQIDFSNKEIDINLQVYFENETDLLFFRQLRSYHCIICAHQQNKTTDFKSLLKLAEHLKMAHQKYFCEVCAGNQKVFPYEFELFTKSEFIKHKKFGFTKSKHKPNVEPHPRCKFCNEICFDNDALYNHLESRHVSCQFCRARGRHVYERDMESLRLHFKKKHYLCEAPECLAQQFVVFDNARDLNLHFINFHGKEKNGSESYKKFSDFTPTQFTLNRQRTRNTFTLENGTITTRDLENTLQLTSVEFPELPKSKAKPKPVHHTKKTFSEKLNPTPEPVFFPPLPSAIPHTEKNSLNLNSTRKDKIKGKKGKEEKRNKKISSTESLLNQLILGGNSKAKESNEEREREKERKRKRVLKQKKMEEQKKLESVINIFSVAKNFPMPFKYEELPMKHADLHKRLKQIGGEKKFEKFRKNYFELASGDIQPDEFCKNLLNTYGVTFDSLVSLYDITRLITDEKKAKAIFEFCTGTDFNRMKKETVKSKAKNKQF